MADQIGNITVPEISVSGTFPIVSDYPYGYANQPNVAIHQFGSGNAKIEQRFMLGTGARRFTVRRAWLKDSERIALRDFWESKYGPYGAFTYNAPNDDGVGTTAYTCRFANEPLSWEMVEDWICSTGLTLVEIPSTVPDYTLNSSLSRFPSQDLSDALLSQVQQVVPLIKIQPLEAGYPAIYLSDRRCTVGGQLYQARLLTFDGISQGMGGESDDASFTFGNADRVMRDLANDVDLYRASIEFSLFHVGTGVKLDLWKGDVINWTCDDGPEFKVTAGDGLYELNLPYPPRKISRSCGKPYDSAVCPFSTVGALDLVHFPSADAAKCDKGYETPNGCLAHGMKRYYGAIVAEPQGVRIKDNSTGTWGFGRSPLTSVSLVADSIYDQVLPEIYTDSDMPVNCKLAAGREESDFYEALGIVGEGPITFTTPRTVDKDGDGNSETFVGHTLDGQANHGYPKNSDGLRTIPGNDPAGATDFFSLDESGNHTGGDFRKVYSGNSTYKDNFAAGTAAVVIRRTDPKGMQLTKLAEHQMVAVISQGLHGWIWTDSGDHQTFVRSSALLTNPLWIAVNMVLRARGVWLSDAATQERYFDVKALADATLVNGKPKGAALVCDLMVDALVGAGQETQFKFRGVMQEEKPLRDWLQEVLMNCLGYFTFSFGKLKFGLRQDSSAVEAFTEGNILFRSLQVAPLKPTFNHLTANFADQDFDFVNNSITVYDMDHAALIAGGAGPLFLKSNANLAGTSSKSQAGRIISVRLREELGGTTAAEWKAARQVGFKTTVLALNTEPGMVCSMTNPSMPGGAGEFRVTSWKLNPDFSIDIQGRTTTDSMYNLLTGPKPADVVPAPVPIELTDPLPLDVQPIGGVPFLVTKTEDGVNAVLECEYDPPDPIGSFAGVVAHVEDPDGSGVVALANPYDYDGDPTAAAGSAERRGHCNIVYPQPVAAGSTIRVYLTSRTRTYAKPLLFHGSSIESPSVTVDLGQATPPLAAPDPIAPTACDISVLESGDNFGLRTDWTPANPYGGTCGYEREVRYYSDNTAATPISEWIPLGARYGAAETTADSGFWPKPTVAEYVRLRVRGYNADGDVTSWVESATPLPEVPQSQGTSIPAPAAPTDPVVSVLDQGGNYGLRTSWTAPVSLGSTVGYDREARFYSDANGVTAISDWIPLGPVGTDVTTADSGFWPRPGTTQYVRFRVRGFNGLDAKSDWVQSSTPLPAVAPFALPPAPVSNDSTLQTDTIGGIPSFRFHLVTTSGGGTTDGYQAQARFYSDAGALTPISEWIPLGWIDPATPTLDTDWWPRADAQQYAKVRIAAQNADGKLGPWLESAVLTKPASGGLTVPVAGDVTLGTPQVRFSPPDASGKVYALITIPFTAPNPAGAWDHVWGYLSAPDDEATNSKAVVGADGDTGFFVGPAAAASNITPTNNPVPFGPFGAVEPAITIKYPAPDGAQAWRVRAPSGSTQAENDIATAPTATFTVDPAAAIGPNGAEYAPNASGFTVTPAYQSEDGGNKTWGYNDSWTNPTSDPRYALLGGYDVVVEYADGRRETQDSPAKNRTSGSATGWTIPVAAETYKIWLVAWDVYGRRNSIVAGVTPCVSVTIGPQVGDAGQEYAALVSGLAVSVAYSKAIDGIEQWTITVTWTNPGIDPAFAGGKIVLRPSSGADQTLGYVGKSDTQAVFGPFNIGAPITYTPYFVSMDNNGRENTLVPGTTPSAAPFTVQAQTTGGINAGRLDPTTLNPTLAIVGNKLGVPDGALSIASFAATIRPPLLLASNPALPNADYPAGTLLYNTTEHKLYRVAPAGNAWQAAVGASDLVANSITAGQLAAGAVGTQQLYAGEILVGGGGNKPGRFKVVAADGSTMVAWIGDDGAGHQGIYAKNLWVGPTINTPQFYCDASGNATFAGALAASVVYAGKINCDQLNAGTINAAVTLTSPRISITSSGVEMVGLYNVSSYGMLQLLNGDGSGGVSISAVSPISGGGIDVQGGRSYKISGTTVIDGSRNGYFTNHYTKAEIDALLAGKADHGTYGVSGGSGNVTI